MRRPTTCPNCGGPLTLHVKTAPAGATTLHGECGLILVEGLGVRRHRVVVGWGPPLGFGRCSLPKRKGPAPGGIEWVDWWKRKLSQCTGLPLSEIPLLAREANASGARFGEDVQNDVIIRRNPRSPNKAFEVVPNHDGPMPKRLWRDEARRRLQEMTRG